MSTAKKIQDTKKAVIVKRNPRQSAKKSIDVPVSAISDTGTSDVTNEVNINVRNPVPLELENRYAFSPGGNKYIPFLTEQNDDCYGFDTFFNLLLALRSQSSTLGSVLNSKTDFIIGDGFYWKGEDDKKKDKEWKSFYKRINPKESANSLLKKIVVNYLNFGNSPIEIVRGETGGERWLHVYAKNQLDCRKSWPDGNNESEAMIISRWFRKRGYMNLTQKYNIRIPFYEMGDGANDESGCWIQDKTNNQNVPVPPVWRTALWLKNDFPGYDHYGLPDWIESMIDAELEYAGSVYNHDNLKNGMHIGGMLHIAGNITPDEKKKFARDLVNTFTGKGKGLRTMVVASNDNVTNSKWEPFSTHQEGSYLELDSTIKDKIIMANKWDGAFLGNKDGMTKAKSGAYLNELYQQKIKTVIKPIHRVIKDGFIVPLCEIANDWLGTDWDSDNLDIQVSNLFNDTTEASTTVNGGVLLLNVLKEVGNGILPHANAVNFLVLKFGMEKHIAEGLVNGIKVILPKNKTSSVIETV